MDKTVAIEYQKALITYVLEGAKISQGALAKEIGVSRNSVNAYVNGRSVMKLDVLLSIAYNYGVRLDLIKALVYLTIGMSGINNLIDDLFSNMDDEDDLDDEDDDLDDEDGVYDEIT